MFKEFVIIWLSVIVGGAVIVGVSWGLFSLFGEVGVIVALSLLLAAIILVLDHL